MKQEFFKAKQALDKHGVIAFPTETVMGFAVYYDDEAAYNKLNKVKRRPEDKPYTLMVKDIYEIDKYAYVDDKVRKIINKYMPGPITLLLKAKEGLPSWVTHNSGIIGIRMPSNEIGLALLKAVEKPLLVPSANRSGEKPALNSKEVELIFHDEIDYIVSGSADLAKPSTIVDLSKQEVKVVREGPISLQDILETIKY